MMYVSVTFTFLCVFFCCFRHNKADYNRHSFIRRQVESHVTSDAVDCPTRATVTSRWSVGVGALILTPW